MSSERASITEDKVYKPSTPEGANRHFFVEVGAYRWEVYVWRHAIKETGTPLYRAMSSEGHTCYGLTINEALNDLAAIMSKKVSAYKENTRLVALDSVRTFLDPVDAAREDLKIADKLSRKSLFAKILGY